MLPIIKRLFGKKVENQQTPQMYDLRHCGWGHSVVFEGAGKIPNSQEVHGWLTPRVSKGDTFLFPATKGLAIWQLIEVENCSDPEDMFFGTVGIIRYATEQDLKQVESPEPAKSEFRFI